MSRYLLDTNIISDAIKPAPSPSLSAWMLQQVAEDLFIASITLGEIWRGILEKSIGKKRRALESWFLSQQGPRTTFAGRILLFDEKAGLIWGRLMAEGTNAGRPRSGLDMIVAAIAEANNCTLVTANEKHFAGLKFINPMRL
ncbi:MAG TPA: type II toxin-antitoxin system VapC family toxin [Terracidiphilus sp.]|nr:type II toxin-antitoxin system VapC family toxin [Terracidiphilus sp.]